MFVIESDKTIKLTRGDILFFGVSAEDRESGEKYIFQPGDIVRVGVFGKKDVENVLMQKDFAITTPTEDVEIFLSEEDTKIGPVINKATDYWYEIVLNPDVKPQTIIGFDDEGAKVLKLYPEGGDIYSEDTEILPEDIPVVDEELDVLSDRPVKNKAIAKAILSLNETINEIKNKLGLI